MFFFFSKTLGYIIRPLFIVCAGLVAAWVIKNPRWKKRLFIFSVSLLLFLSNEFIANEVLLMWEIKTPPFSEIKKRYEYAILLSGVARQQVGPPDRVYLGSGADRITHALYLYKLGYIKKILISGGSGRLLDIGEKEADQLAALLLLMGVPAEDIITENNSRNTHESAMEVKKILDGKVTPDQCILITSANHMRRSSWCFSKVGWPVDNFSTDFISHDRNYTFDSFFIPKIEAFGNWNVLFKEWAGCIAYWFAGYI